MNLALAALLAVGSVVLFHRADVAFGFGRVGPGDRVAGVAYIAAGVALAALTCWAGR